MEVSIHCGRRYCERIKGIEEKTSGSYYHQNKEMIDTQVLAMFEHAKEFYNGKIKSHPKRSYLKHRDIIIVADETSVITLFKIGFGGLSTDKVEEVLEIMLLDLGEKLTLKSEEEERITNDIKIFNAEINEANQTIIELKEKIAIEQAHINANLEYKKASQLKVKQLDYVINDMFEAIIGKGFSGELQ